MKNKNTGLRSTVWAFILAACGKSTHQSADAPAPQLRETPRETPKETVTSDGNVSDGNATPLQTPDKTVPDATTPKDTVTEEPSQTDDQTENAAPETTPSDADNAPVPPLVTAPEKPKDPPPQEPAPPVTPQGEDVKPQGEDVKVERETPPPPLIQRAALTVTTPTYAHAFTFRPEDIPDTAEPKGLARHLISGKAWVMPHKGPLKLTWAVTAEQAAIYAAKVESVLERFEAVVNIEFEQIASSDYDDANLRFWFDDSIDGGSSGQPKASGISIDYRHNPSLRLYMHEIAHALGLDHPYDENDYGWPENDEDYGSSHETIMSYWKGWYSSETRNARLYEDEKYAGLGKESGLQQADIEALQFLYGKPNTDWQSPERFFERAQSTRGEFIIRNPEIKIAENTSTETPIYDAQAHNDLWNGVRFTLPKGVRDNDLFRVDENGLVYFRQSPDYENPHDISGGAKFGYNNVYEIAGISHLEPGLFFSIYRFNILIEVENLPEII